MNDTIVMRDRRQVPRLFLNAQANLRLERGLSLRGKTQNLNEEGCLFIPNTADDEVQVGDEGSLCFIMKRNQQEVFAEIPAVVANIVQGGLELELECADIFAVPADTVRGKSVPREVDPEETVFVHRRNSLSQTMEFEEGWQVLSDRESVPRSLLEELMAKQTSGICVVCRKIVPSGQEMYKVYYVLDLLAIQLMAYLASVEG